MKTYEKPIAEVFASMSESILGFSNPKDQEGYDGGIGGFAKRHSIIVDDEYLSGDISFAKDKEIQW